MKAVKEESFLTYAQVALVRNDLQNVSFSYVKKEFNTRELQLIIQENIIAINDVTRAIEPQVKEVQEMIVPYNLECTELERKYNIGKDVVLSKEDKESFESELVELREKYKSDIEKFKKADKELIDMMDTKKTGFSIKSKISKSMLPANITREDMARISHIIEW